MKPSYWICGTGGNVNCEDWDDVNGCWQNCKEYCGYKGDDENDKDNNCI